MVLHSDVCLKGELSFCMMNTKKESLKEKYKPYLLSQSDGEKSTSK